jgi:DNA transposition AAA+ family ATPase
MITLEKFLKNCNISCGEAARLLGVDKSQVVKVSTHSYPNWETKEAQFIETLRQKGCRESITHTLAVDTNILVMTKSVSDYMALADDLSDPEGSLSSSIGMAVGTAERGKTHASKFYCQSNENAVYVLYVDGSTKVQLLRDICDQIAHTRPYSFGSCITIIEESCKYTRRLVIIDEADKLPVQYLEMLRGLNERCNLPLLLVGEEGLKTKTDRVPRLRSRIRKPVVVFEAVHSVDVAAYYHEAAGIDIDRQTAERLVRHAGGGFRSIVNDSIALSKMAKASSLDTITDTMLTQLCA